MEVGVPRTRVPELLRGADVFAMPSRAEGLPLSLLEAGSARVPIIASAVGGIPELVRHEVNGLLIPSDDLDALESGLRRLLTDAELREQLSRAMREEVLAHWTWEATCQGYCELLRD
jgi:glycosyltransferase involved in cell wall biosynthesis